MEQTSQIPRDLQAPGDARQRVLPLAGGRNFRDLGGYPTKDGRRVKWGRLFRSGTMAFLTDADYDYLSDIGINVVVDLRSNEERAGEPTEWRANPTAEYVAADYEATTGNEGLVTMFRTPDVSPEKMRDAMISLYETIPLDHAPRYRDIFNRLADGQAPLAWNCSAGKDRAGTAAALVLTALGVSKHFVRNDYALSDQVVDFEAAFTSVDDDSPYTHLAQIPRQVLRPVLRSDPDYISALFTSLKRDFGSPFAYLDEALGVDRAMITRLRELYLE